MKIATTSPLFARHPLEKAFQIASSLGYDGIELWGGRPHAYAYDMTPERIDQILRLKERYRVDIPIYLPEVTSYPYNVSSPDPVEREETVVYLQRGLEVARALGIPRVLINSGHAGFGTTRRENMKNIRSVFLPVVAHAEKVGVDIIIEALTPMESNTIFLLDDLVELIEDLNSDRVKSMLDTVTPLINYEPYYEHFEKLGDKLDYIHFVDSNGIDQTHMGIGTGVLDMRELLDLIRRYHYDGWLSIELLSCGAREPEIYAGREIRALRRLLSELE